MFVSRSYALLRHNNVGLDSARSLMFKQTVIHRGIDHPIMMASVSCYADQPLARNRRWSMTMFVLSLARPDTADWHMHKLYVVSDPCARTPTTRRRTEPHTGAFRQYGRAERESYYNSNHRRHSLDIVPPNLSWEGCGDILPSIPSSASAGGEPPTTNWKHFHGAAIGYGHVSFTPSYQAI